MVNVSGTAFLLCFNRLVGYLDEQGVISRDGFADSLVQYAEAQGGDEAEGMIEVGESIRPRAKANLAAIDGGKAGD